MTKRTHYSGQDIMQSSKTRLVKKARVGYIYSHRIPTIAGTHVVVWNQYEWTAYDSLEQAEREAEGA